MTTPLRTRTRGMVLGKFLPPHAGHLYLCEVARRWVDELTIVVGTLRREPICGETRLRWMRELFPFDEVVHLPAELPQEPAEHPDFWSLWKTALERVLPAAPDIVFASDDYGETLARVLGARFVQVDATRSVVPISGTAIRADPRRHWAHLPRCVRPHFVQRVSVFGPESTGKTTLARALAARFDTVWVPEWARQELERAGGIERLAWDDVVRGQIASEEALARDANCLLVCDTDPLATEIWAEVVGASWRPEAPSALASRAYDLTLLLAPDVPWVADPARLLPDGGGSFFARCEEALVRTKRRYVVVRGSWEERLATAIAAIEALQRSHPGAKVA